MSARKCIFTNKDSNTKRSIIPKSEADEEIHNWTLYSPMNMDYDKENRMPTNHEMEMHETFYMLELARLKVKYLEMKLKDLQEKNPKPTPNEPQNNPKPTPEPSEELELLKKGNSKKKKRKTKKEKEIEMAEHEKEVVQNVDLDKALEKRRKKKKDMWE